MGCLVTGVGYIGTRLAERLLEAGEEVVGLDNLFSTDPLALESLSRDSHFTFIEGDVRDEEVVRRAFRSGPEIGTVYHLAAQASANPSAAPVLYTEETNLIAPRVVIEQACAAGAGTFVFGSSFQIYGRRPPSRVDESTPFGPILDISHLSKVYVEKLMEMFSVNRGLRCSATRIGLVYGLSPVMKTDPRFMTAPNKFCLQAARGEALRVDASAFNPTSMVHVEDVVRGLMLIAQEARDGFSAANLLGETASVAQVASLVRRLAEERGLTVDLIAPDEQPEPPRSSFHSVLDGLGFAPQMSLERGLAEVLDYFLARADLSPDPSPTRGGEYSPFPRREGGRGLGPPEAQP